jgi:hypothetical protein
MSISAHSNSPTSAPPDENAVQPMPWVQPCETQSRETSTALPGLLTQRNCEIIMNWDKVLFMVISYVAI